MPGTPATSPRHGAPRYANTDTSDFAGQVNAVTDRFDITAARFDEGLAAARPAPAIAGRYYWATDTNVLTRDTGTAWVDPTPPVHAARHQDGGADALTVREAMMATGALGMAKGSFSAYRSAALSVTSSQVVVFDSEDFDISSWHDITTGRFTPQLAGIYSFSWAVASATAMTADSYLLASLRRNGAVYKRGSAMNYRAAASGTKSVGTALGQANGTTDYFDILVENNFGTIALTVGGAITYFQGELVGRT